MWHDGSVGSLAPVTQKSWGFESGSEPVVLSLHSYLSSCLHLIATVGHQLLLILLLTVKSLPIKPGGPTGPGSPGIPCEPFTPGNPES